MVRSCPGKEFPHREQNGSGELQFILIEVVCAIVHHNKCWDTQIIWTHEILEFLFDDIVEMTVAILNISEVFVLILTVVLYVITT